MNFSELIHIIQDTNKLLKQRAYVAVNQSLTIRNWLTGLYIIEFEQNGEDRATYGTKIIEKLSKPLMQSGIKAATARDLRKYRQFYKTYPQIRMTLTSELSLKQIWMSVSSKFNNDFERTIPALLAKEKASKNTELGVSPKIILNSLSFSHIAELIKISEPLKRAFYEIECIRGNWSVRELQRQIGSLLFERTGLSKNKEKLIKLTNQQATQLIPEDIVRDPYFFEFFGLKQQDVLPENKLEDLLIKHLQEFLLELGKGFCFEARQKRITIDNIHYYVDLVFYHKILKCNVIIELKSRKFRHEDASQLRIYLNYYKEYEMQDDDNPPIGILLCTDKSEELVRFATTGIEEQVFISKYMLELPSEKDLHEFIKKEKKLYL